MSEQNQSNFQALGAGLLGFVAVLAVGGGALMIRSSQQAKSAAKPVAAAAPIDIGAAAPRPAMPSPRLQREENRAESPAPLIGSESGPSAVEASLAGASDSSPESAPTADAAARLKVTRHLEAAGGASTAEAVVKNTSAPEKTAAKSADKKKPLSKSVAASAGTDAVASVHYGVTSRSELMGRAAGPVYNVAGGGKKGGTIATGKIAGDTKATLADLQRRLEDAGLPEDQRAKLKKELESAANGLSEEAEKTAQ